MFGRGLVIGKFAPPHQGHHWLINTALEQAEQVTVIVCAKPADIVPGEVRAQWLRELHPRAHVRLIDDRYDENDTAVWATNTIAWLGQAPDVVFTSEDYGPPYARAMNCAHVMVDRARAQVPCSGTAVRGNPWKYWEFLESPVRAWFALRVCVLGAESTGTTTLAQALAEHYQTVWVPEYGREYSAEKQQRGELNWTSEEFECIAREQNRREQEAARDARRVLVCDTNSYATCLWHRRYLGRDSAAVARVAAQTRCDYYLLTGDEIPFVQDGLRDGEAIRHKLHGWFELALQSQPVPWRLLRGSPRARLEAAVTLIDELLATDGYFQGSPP